ncbi:MAG TPA: LysM peptidoglycan-binding domain-containing protein [Terriglobales bacterium]
MRIYKGLIALPLLGATILYTGCESKDGRQAARTTPPKNATAPTIADAKTPDPAPAAAEPKAAPQQESADPVAVLIEQVEREYQKGQTNYQAGHLDAAKDNFDHAFDMLVKGKIGVRDDDRLQAEFDKVVEAVHTLEMQALKEGDGFTEQQAEPAPIDEANEVTFPVDPNVRAKAEAELRVTRSDLPLMMTDQVASFINYFSTRGRGTIEHALARSGRYREMISRVFREEGVPQDLIYLAQAESGFHPLALSRAGARGMWQFMASRASGYGLERNWWVDERQDPEKATRAAARHLKDLYNQFGDWYLAMAAYNSGPLTVQRAVQRTGYADFWELYRRNVLPKETRNYVPIIVAVTIMAKNPEQYGLEDVVPEKAPEVDRVKVNYPVDLRLVAECTDTPLATLQDLNPSLLRMTTPKDMEFTLNVPKGTGEKFETAIAAIPQDMRVWWRYHKVQDGESLSEIASRYHTTTKAIAEVNNLADDTELETNAKLIIPVTPGKKNELLTFSKHPTRYRVRKGDTVASVADDFGVPVEKLRKWNRIRGNYLRAGRTVVIYRPVGATEYSARSTASRGKKTTVASKKKDSAAQPEIASKASKNSSLQGANRKSVKHKVKRGETLTSIANDYNTTIEQLKKDNALEGSNLKAGQVLLIR